MACEVSRYDPFGLLSLHHINSLICEASVETDLIAKIAVDAGQTAENSRDSARVWKFILKRYQTCIYIGGEYFEKLLYIYFKKKKIQEKSLI